MALLALLALLAFLLYRFRKSAFVQRLAAPFTGGSKSSYGRRNSGDGSNLLGGAAAGADPGPASPPPPLMQETRNIASIAPMAAVAAPAGYGTTQHSSPYAPVPAEVSPVSPVSAASFLAPGAAAYYPRGGPHGRPGSIASMVSSLSGNSAVLTQMDWPMPPNTPPITPKASSFPPPSQGSTPPGPLIDFDRAGETTVRIVR